MPEALAGRLCDVLHFIQLSQLSPIIFDDEEGHEDVAIPPGARCDQVPWPRVLAPDVCSRGHNHDCGSHGNAGYRKHRAGSAGGRYFGSDLTGNLLSQSTVTQLQSQQFNMVTPGNEMKWDTTEPSNGTFNFGPGDQIVSYAQAHGERVRCHNLVWQSQLPSWVSS